MGHPVMSHHSQCSRLLYCLQATLALLAAGCSRSAGPPEFRPPAGYLIVDVGGSMSVMTEEQKRIEEILDSPATLQFPKGTTPQAAAKYISEKYGIAVLLKKNFEEEFTSSDIGGGPVVQGLALRDALKVLLEPLAATYFTNHGVLYLCTRDEADDNLVMRVYYVKDLVGVSGGFTGRDPHSLLGWSWSESWGTASPLGMKSAPASSNTDDYDSLIELIKEIIDPDSWDDNGGPAMVREFHQRHCLAISAAQTVHGQVAELLRKLRTIPPL